MSGFNNIMVSEIQKMINGYAIPEDIMNVFSKNMFYSKKLSNGLSFNFGTNCLSSFLSEYNINAMLYDGTCLKVGDIGSYDLIYVFKDNDWKIYLANASNGYSSYEMVQLHYSLIELFNNPELICEYLGSQSKKYFNTTDFQLCENFTYHSEIPLEFYSFFGRNSEFVVTIGHTDFYIGASSFDELLYLSNDINTTLTGPSLIIGKDEGEVNILYLFDKNGAFKGLYGISDDNLGDDDGLVYISGSLTDFLKGIGYENYLKILK